MKNPSIATAVSALLGVSLLAAPSYADRQSTVVQAQVVSADPIIEQLTERIPHEICRNERVRVERRGGSDSATPTILGAVVGGALGGALGNHSGAQGVITGAGALLGASVGRDISRQNRTEQVRYVNEEVCNVEYELRDREEVTGYRVSYRIGDTIYQTRTDSKPGATLPVRIDIQPLP